jgi:O-antigen/teichoic acid export membrane protein
MAAGLGVDLLLLQKVSARPEKLPALLRAVSRLVFRAGLVLGAAMIMVTWFLSADAEARRAAVFFGVALPASSLAATLEASWVSLGNAHRVALIVMLEHSIRLLFSFAALAMGGGPAALALVLCASKWLGTALLLLPLRKVGGTTEPITLSTLIRQASPFALFFAASALLHRMDSLAVAVFRPLVDVGYYGAATRLVLLPTIVSQAFGIALYPHLARARAVPDRFDRLARAALLAACAASFVPAGVLMAFPEPILRLLGMEDYLPAASLLALLALALPALFSTEVLFRSLLARDRLGACLRVAGLQVGLGAVTLIVATNLYGVRGAALVTVGFAWLGTAGYLFSLYNNRPGDRRCSDLIHP